MIASMYADGARIFLEVGPGGTLTSLAGGILGQQPHLAVALDPPGRSGIHGLLLALGRLFAAGLSPQWNRLTRGRDVKRLDTTRFIRPGEPTALSHTTWLVNGARSRPAFGPEPARLGPGPALPPPSHANETPMNAHENLDGHAHRNGRSDSPSRNGSSHPVANTFAAHLDDDMAEPGSDVTRVLEAFQKTMQTFLEVQRDTMLGFLGAAKPESHGFTPSPTNGRLSAYDFEHHERPARRPEIHPEVVATEPTPAPVPTPAPAPVPPSKVEAPAPAASQNGKHTEAPKTEDVADRLLSIVRDRTGYPAEMLRLDLDLEADLGIDSIKRVEILGSLRDALPNFPRGSNTEMMDQLSRAKTLGAIVERVTKAMNSGSGEVAQPSPRAESVSKPKAARPPVSRPTQGDDVQRLVIEAVESPLQPAISELRLAPGGVVLITDDGRGIAQALASELHREGHPTLIVAAGRSSNELASGRDAVDFNSQDSVDALLSRIRERGSLAGIIHVLPLRSAPAANLDLQEWKARLDTEVKGLFLLARGAAEDLARSAGQGGACLIAGTGMGGSFASSESPQEFFPGQGAIAGMVKTLAREWPKEVRVRVVDLDPQEASEMLASHLYREIAAEDAFSEVGYRREERIVLKAVPAKLSRQKATGIQLSKGAPILVTGGARGITATVVNDLARRWQPKLLIVGSSPLPVGSEDASTSGLDGTAELKSALHRRLTANGKSIGPAELERVYRDLRREREIRANLSLFQASGATVEYAQIDVRDREALRKTLAGWRESFGPIAGLIHGAGVIEDKMLRDKTLASFDRVLGTKLEGALNLAGLLDAEPPQFAAFFSSVAGRFGNKGQADYAAANEALNKLALWLDSRWAGRVVSIIWGPWSGVGMVSDLEGHLGRQGLGMIPPHEGATRLGDELQFGRKGDVEVVVAGDVRPLMTNMDLGSDKARQPVGAGSR